MRPQSAFAAALLTLAIGGSMVCAATPVVYGAAVRPSIQITSVIASHGCVTARVRVTNFVLVPPDFRHARWLKGNRGHIHYILNGPINFRASRDASSKETQTWCGRNEGVKRGRNTVEVFLATAHFQLFPGTQPVSRSVTAR